MFDACKHLFYFYTFIFPVMINQAKGIASYDWDAIIYSTNYLFYSAEDSFAHTEL